MAKEDIIKAIMEFEVERDTISTTLEELKRSYETRELDEVEYETSKNDYEAKLRAVESNLNELMASQAGEEAKIPEKGKVKKSIGEEVDYSKASWKELRRIAGEKGVALGKGVTREKIIDELNKMQAEPRLEKAHVAEHKVDLRLDIDSKITAQVEIFKGEIPSLDSTLSTLNMKKLVVESSLNVLKKNKKEGLIDDATFSRLKEKYESEIRPINQNIVETSNEISLRKNIVSKFDELSTTNLEHKRILKKLEDELINAQTEFDFMEVARLFIVSYLKKYLTKVLDRLTILEEEKVSKGISYPDENFLENKKDRIKDTRDEIKELKIKLDNFETLLSSLEKDKEEGDIKPETYTVLSSEYTKEKNSKERKLGQLKGRLKTIERELKNFENLDESINSCQSLVDLMDDSFRKIYLNDSIAKKTKEIKSKTNEIDSQKKEMNRNLVKLEETLKVSLKM
jgi:chromosome segregation ATPase